jgi:diguanylate cyclase (GGDEF)-like protein/PAS domain S-box-containing protein
MTMFSRFWIAIRYSIAAKLYMLTLVSVGALAVLATASTHFANQAQIAAGKLYLEGVEGVQKVTHLEILFEQHRALITAVPAELQRARIRQIQQTVADLDERIDGSLLAVGAQRDAGIQQLLQEIGADVPKLKQSGHRVLMFADNFAQDQALAISQGDYSQAADNIRSALRVWHQDQITSVNREVDGLASAAHNLTWWVVAAAVTAFVLIGPLTLWAQYRIVGRLRRLTAAMRQLCNNEMSVEVPFTKALDEVGDIARSIDVFKNNGNALALAHLQLDAALNNMPQGLCLFDSNARLLVWNKNYIQMYRIDPNKVGVGNTLRDVLEARVTAGTFPLDPAMFEVNLFASLKANKPFLAEVELDDGRVISVIHQPTADGGWVATHEDVTERTRDARELKRTQGFLDTIINHVPAAIVVKELPSFRYVLVNRTGEKYFGLPGETMIGKTAAQIFPKAAADIIEAHDKSLLQTGKDAFFDSHEIYTTDGNTRIVTSTRVPIFGPDGNPQYLIGVIQDVTERKRDQARIAHMAHHDSLTELPNRAAFNERLAVSLERAAAEKESFAVLCLDLDRFKEVNDVFGHATGDLLLRSVASRLQDACDGVFVARLGGDEFSVITGFGPQPATAEGLTSRLTQALTDDIEVDGHRLRIGLTIGVSVYPDDGSDVATLLANADAALYRAKAEARGTIRFFEPEMDKRLREKRAMQHDLRSAIERNELELYYQPQALIGGEISGFEALVRWHHPSNGMVAPGMFIPLAEESGIIMQLGEWILREACREAASWSNPLRIAVNLSPVQFRHGDLAALVHGILLETGLSPGRLELEITESVLIGDFSRAVSILRRLKNLGVRIAMDDFGTGYSSLSYLQSFPFDKIKIDQAFISNLSQNPQSGAIIRAIIGLGRGLHLPVVAEGVETKEQLAFLVSEECDEVQGYLIGRPQPIAHYARLVGRDKLALPTAAAS